MWLFERRIRRGRRGSLERSSGPSSRGGAIAECRRRRMASSRKAEKAAAAVSSYQTEIANGGFGEVASTRATLLVRGDLSLSPAHLSAPICRPLDAREHPCMRHGVGACRSNARRESWRRLVRVFVARSTECRRCCREAPSGRRRRDQRPAASVA